MRHHPDHLRGCLWNLSFNFAYCRSAFAQYARFEGLFWQNHQGIYVGTQMATTFVVPALICISF
jgi:hypothetical protein